jgi:soluble lytic murein transglycosylase-like protein
MSVVTVEQAMHINTAIALLLLGSIGAIILGKKSKWAPPAAAMPYLHLFRAASLRHGVPELLLLRVAQQESAFRQDIITGRLSSAAGAQGIMQIVPRWHPGVDPLNVPEAVDYAAGYLKQLHNRFGTWAQALAAYNWGQGNLDKYKSKQIENIPAETANYVASIMADVFPGERII